jgi:hypothetical protein
MNMTDLIREKIQDEFRYAHAGQSFFSICNHRCVPIEDILGVVIVQSFHELNEYVDAMIILYPSRKKDGTGPLAVCLSPVIINLVY